MAYHPRQGQGKLQLEWGSTMYHLEDIPYRGDLSDFRGAFTNFRYAAWCSFYGEGGIHTLSLTALVVELIHSRMGSGT